MSEWNGNKRSDGVRIIRDAGRKKPYLVSDSAGGYLGQPHPKFGIMYRYYKTEAGARRAADRDLPFGQRDKWAKRYG